jgi:hypothetical protein
MRADHPQHITRLIPDGLTAIENPFIGAVFAQHAMLGNIKKDKISI